MPREETASARLASPIELRPEELEARPAEYDPRRASSRFPAPWPGGTWALADIVRTQQHASLALLADVAAHREHWLRTALAVNRRACERRAFQRRGIGRIGGQGRHDGERL